MLPAPNLDDRGFQDLVTTPSGWSSNAARPGLTTMSPIPG